MMRKLLLLTLCAWSASLTQAETADSLALQEVVVTGTRNATDVRHLPMTVTVIGREKLTMQHQPSVLPTVMQEVPGLFVTSRAMKAMAFRQELLAVSTFAVSLEVLDS